MRVRKSRVVLFLMILTPQFLVECLDVNQTKELGKCLTLSQRLAMPFDSGQGQCKHETHSRATQLSTLFLRFLRSSCCIIFELFPGWILCQGRFTSTQTWHRLEVRARPRAAGQGKGTTQSTQAHVSL
jgi:hypothetical protein